MRVVPGVAALLLVVGCSDNAAHDSSPNVKTWKAGDAVVVVTADVTRGQLDLARLIRLPGVIAAGQRGQSLTLSLSRQALVVDLAAVELELARTPGVINVRDQVVPPAH